MSEGDRPRVLVLVAPAPDLRVEKEAAAIVNVLNESTAEVIGGQSHAIENAQDLLKALNDTRVDIVHYAGHADTNQLLLKDGAGHTGGLAAVLREQKLSLVFLNGCATSEFATALTSDGMGQPVGAVLATTSLVDDEAAYHLGVHFYERLVRGVSLHVALEHAKSRVFWLLGDGSGTRSRHVSATSRPPPKIAYDEWEFKVGVGYQNAQQSVLFPQSLELTRARGAVQALKATSAIAVTLVVALLVLLLLPFAKSDVKWAKRRLSQPREYIHEASVDHISKELDGLSNIKARGPELRTRMVSLLAVLDSDDPAQIKPAVRGVREVAVKLRIKEPKQ